MYLGTLGHGHGDGLSDRRPSGSHHSATTSQLVGVPSQSWRSSHVQWNGGANDGFMRSVAQVDPTVDPTVAMGYWDERDLPFYAALARTFALADRWFCSCLGPTFPNRRFLVAATADGLIDDELASVIDYPRTGTIFDVLDRYGISWADYHHVGQRELYRSQLRGAGMYLDRRARLLARRLLPGVVRQVRGDIRCTASLYPTGLLRIVRHLRPVEQFFAQAAAGTLPAFSIVDPDFAHGSEENPQDIRSGQAYTAKVIDAVMSGPGWGRTLMFWVYDEHGGYYDHVPPPAAVEPDDVLPRSLLDAGQPLRWLLRHSGAGRRIRYEDAGGGRYDRYGFRVPAVIVSPFARPGFVSSQVYDHTSILKLIEEKWNLPPLTERDAAAVAPWDMLDLDGAPAFLEPPRLPSA